MKAFTLYLVVSLLSVGCMSIVTAAGTPFSLQPSTLNLSLPQITTGLPLPITTVLSDTGFGDRLNSYAWAMGVFNSDLYVGTGRFVTTFHPMWEAIWGGLSPGTRPEAIPDCPEVPFIQDWLAYTPTNLPYIANPAKYEEWKAGSQAEIWRFSIRTKKWTRVFQAPFVPSLLVDATGKSYSTASVMGFRKMDVFKDSGGASALFAFVGGLSFANPLSAPLIYRSTNGTTWQGVATPVGMGRETRSSTVHNNRLYVGSGVGPSVWCTDTSNPNAGSWTKVLDFSQNPTRDITNSGIISLASFNNKLYVGTENINGFQVWCGSGTPGDNTWVKVISDGGVDRYNAWAATMKVFKNNLIVGTIGLPYLGGSPKLKGFDIFSIDRTNKWTLLVGGGSPADPVPGYENVRSASGMPSGFGNSLAFYCWSIEVFDNNMYIGTFDASVFLRYLSEYTGPLPPELEQYRTLGPMLASGADVWRTSNGTSWLPITLNGFGHDDNYGVRTMQVFNKNLVFGLNNPFDGCEVRTLMPMYVW